MNYKYFFLTLFLLSLSCARVPTLNLKEQRFGITPNHIIWIHIAGLSEEQLSLIKFDPENVSKKSVFESASCIGRMWSYNLESLRPRPLESFLSQAMGKKDVTRACSSSKTLAFWGRLKDLGYKTALLESDGKKENSLSGLNACQEKQEFLKGVTQFQMSSRGKENADYFHFEKLKTELEEGKIYYDRSCQKGTCFSSLLSNAKPLYEKFRKEKKKSVFIVKDHSLYKALLGQKTKQIKKVLFDLENLVEYFTRVHPESQRALVLVTSGAERKIEFPAQGKNWKISKRKTLLFKRESLLSSAWSWGARSENFCGLYEEDEILKRILWTPEATTLDLRKAF